MNDAINKGNKELYIGVMSGTSMDGVDTVLVEITGDQIQLLHHNDYPMSDSLKSRLLNISLGQATNLIEIGEIDHLLGHLYADAILELLKISGYQAAQITAIGNHGQTVYHQPMGDAPFTTQLGDANIIAARTQITTVADFRRKDMALGGQGAPLVPAFHQSIFPTQECAVVLNIGGIANISVLRKNTPVLGYDTGPGNMLMDAWCHRHTQQPFDKDAQFAKQGQVHNALLDSLLTEPYLALSAPKSTGRELFNLDWLDKHLSKVFQLENASLPSEDSFPKDVQRTLCEYTALTIANELIQFQPTNKAELLVCGGGAHNPLLMARLTELLPDWAVSTTDAKGIDCNNMEAMAFAWLAYRRIHNLPSNLPEVTGASRLASLGVIYSKD